MAFDIIGSIRDHRQGIQCERTFRAIYLLLSGWCRYSGKRGGRGLAPQGKMEAIPFDKLMTLFARLWNTRFQETGARFADREPGTISEQEDNSTITFPVPFREFPGKHGPGLAVSAEKKREFLVAVLYRLGREDILSYFDIIPPADRPDTPNDYRTTIEPALPATADAELIAAFSELEQTTIGDLSNAIKRLSPAEIRVLGTHENFDMTVKAIEWEFSHMQKHLKQIRTSLERNEMFHVPAQEVLEYADEACRKSERNRDDYANARATFEAELTEPALKAAFLDRQRPADQIWDKDKMPAIAKRANRAHARAFYIERIAHGQAATRSARTDTQMESDLTERIAPLRAEGIRGLPETAALVFVGQSTTLRDETKQRLQTLVSELEKS